MSPSSIPTARGSYSPTTTARRRSPSPSAGGGVPSPTRSRAMRRPRSDGASGEQLTGVVDLAGMTSTVSGPAAERERPPALDAASMCEAFQLTAAARPDEVALRTLGDAVSITFGEYRRRVQDLAAGLHALGVGAGDTVGFMLTNRPEFHLLDTAVM